MLCWDSTTILPSFVSLWVNKDNVCTYIYKKNPYFTGHCIIIVTIKDKDASQCSNVMQVGGRLSIETTGVQTQLSRMGLHPVSHLMSYTTRHISILLWSNRCSGVRNVTDPSPGAGWPNFPSWITPCKWSRSTQWTLSVYPLCDTILPDATLHFVETLS